jgi:hypothetical protein
MVMRIQHGDTMETPEFSITNEKGDAYLNIEWLELNHICTVCKGIWKENHRLAGQGNLICRIPANRKHLCHVVRKYRERPDVADQMEAVMLAERLSSLRKLVTAGKITKRDALLKWGEKRATRYNDIMVDAEFKRIFIDVVE